MAIEIPRGDLLRQENVDAIVNAVNCVGVMGLSLSLCFNRPLINHMARFAPAPLAPRDGRL